jgi:hypothetical protein
LLKRSGSSASREYSRERPPVLRSVIVLSRKKPEEVNHCIHPRNARQARLQ